MTATIPPLRLTQYAAGGGCACKVPPGELERIVRDLPTSREGGDLLVVVGTSEGLRKAERLLAA